MRITVRLSEDLDLRLQRISELVGAPKASICMFALAKYLRCSPNISALPVENNLNIRYALSVPDLSNNLLIEKAELFGTNKNHLVNVLTRYYINNDLKYLSNEFELD